LILDSLKKIFLKKKRFFNNFAEVLTSSIKAQIKIPRFWSGEFLLLLDFDF